MSVEQGFISDGVQMLLNNKDWLFSGVGVLILTVLYNTVRGKNKSKPYSDEIPPNNDTPKAPEKKKVIIITL